jgi:dihydropteroate synthase
MESKDTFFYNKTTLNCGGKILDLSTPKVMGILNITPDSFYDDGRYGDEILIIEQTAKMLEEGASIIDIGAYSSRPNAEDITEAEELKRLIPVIILLKKEFNDIIISVDTFRAKVAEQAAGVGASIINDISGGTIDEAMFKTIAKLNLPYILMHIQGTPKTMQTAPHYDDVFKEVLNYFIDKTTQLKNLGLKDIIIDPGFGFGKTVEHNYELLNKMNDFKILGYPILSGLSRKSMINKVLGCTPTNALNGTTVLNTISLLKGAKILRVHDVKEAVEAVKLCGMLNQTKK